MNFGQHTLVLPLNNPPPVHRHCQDYQQGNKLLSSSPLQCPEGEGSMDLQVSWSEQYSQGFWKWTLHPAPILQVTLSENCKYSEATPPKIHLLNCLKLNLKCMYAAFLSARYSELLLWPYDKRMQEIIANLPPARKRELITASTKSALFQ